MTKESYTRMLDRVREKSWIYEFVTIGGRLLTYVSYIAYPLIIFSIFWRGEDNKWASIVVPAVSFIILSVFRRIVNARRPYQVFDIKPLIPKTTQGESFPSRHVFSAFIIAYTAGVYYPLIGFILTVCGTLLAITRVLAGVHFPRDVVAGAISGIGLGLLGFIIMV